MTAGLLAGSLPPPDAYDADILILSLERVAETEAAIRSALGQTGLSRHVTVLDQGSSAPTLARLAALIATRPDALLASSGENLGVAGGRNRAAGFGHGRVMIALDNDAIFADSGTAARAVALMDEQPVLAAIGFRIMNADGSGEDDASWGYPDALRPQAGGRFPCATFVGAGHAIRRAAWDEVGGYDAALFFTWEEYDFALRAGHAIRRAAWDEVGGYDAALFFTWEEYDFALRAIDRGWRLLHAGDITVHHKLASEGRVEWSARRWFLYVRNRIYISRKWRAGLAALLIRMMGYGIKSMRLGLGVQGARAAAAAWRMPLVTPPRRMSAAGRAYLAAVDTAWRGGLWSRLHGEVMAELPSSRPRELRNGAVINRP